MLAKQKLPERLFTIWAVLALAALTPVTWLLRASFPIFTVLWILIPFVVVVKTRDASQVGMRAVPRRQFFQITGINLGLLLLIMLVFEPWSHTYQMLLTSALAGDPPDTTFAWLLRLPRLPALGMMALYSGTVTLFGEELFFRGWLLQLLQRRLGALWAIPLQAALFTLPNLLVSILIPPLQGGLYALVYTWLAIGMVGGWAAWRTRSIWPSLVSATLCNLILVAWSF